MALRNISAWSIRNPVPPIVFFVLLLLAGIVSFNRMDVNDNPDVVFPLVSVVVAQPGAAPTELETQVTQRVEAAVRSVNGVDELSSYVGEGMSRTMIQFDIGTPIDRAVNDVTQAMAVIRGDLPDGILEPQVTRIDAAGGPITYFAVEATDMSLEQLSWFVDNTVAKELLSIDGMAQVRRSGGVDREIRVILDPARMQSYGITASQVNAQLRQTNLNAAGGRTEIAGSEQAVRVLGNAESAYQLGEARLSLGNGRTIRLTDIATVSDSYAEQRSLAKMRGKQVLSFSIEKARGASDVTVHDETMKILEEIKKENPKVEFKILFTRTVYTKEQYSSSMLALIEGAVLAVIVVFLFLRDWRATLISAIAIPLSAIPTFFFMDLMGFSLNSLSLLALSLVAGVLVDDAIVEIENIVRHMRMGKSAYQASIDAADEIGLAVVATTMTIVAVFLPVALMPGISGQFFIQFGMTVVVAVLLSLAVARLITPMIAAYFLKSFGEEDHASGPWIERYANLLKWTLGHRWTMVGIGVAAFAASIALFMLLPKQFQPTINSDYSQVAFELPPGSTLAQSTAIAGQVTGILDADKNVKDAFAEVNVGGGSIYVTLEKERTMKSVDWERSLQPKLAAIPDARVRFQSQSGGFSGRDITFIIGGDDPVALENHAREIVRQMSGLRELRNPRIEGDIPRPEIIVEPRLDLAADLGVTTAALSQTIRIATIGDIDQNAAKFSLSDRQIPIRVLLAEDSRRSLATLENLPVPTQSGSTVPLKSVAKISFGAGPTELRRYNQTRRIVIGADLAPGLVTGNAQEKIDALPTVKDMPSGIRKIVQGDQKWQAELMMNFAIALVSGLLLVFSTLVLLYRRFLSPLVNMLSLLLAPLGGLLGLAIAGMEISMPVFIGLLMLFGIVGKNSILLIDFAIEEMERGVDKYTALIDAGRKRAQPIVMTTVAMAAGMVPTALSLTGDGAWRAPMGVVVIGGLIVSTLLTLLIVPAGFSLADSIEKRIGRFSQRFITYRDGDDAEGRAVPQPAE
ncbi:MAG: efflux RND transporter permease subunit [Sphingopyxis sp.]|nr:efflux RND transporter permease subunit [Sphingopyxis sp.]